MQFRSDLTRTLRDRSGAAAVEAVCCFLLLFVAVIITLQLFEFTKIGASGPIDNRTTARFAALNDSCSRTGLVPGQTVLTGMNERNRSAIIVECALDVNGQTALEEKDRFWKQLTAVSDPFFSELNRAQSKHFDFNAVQAEQTTHFIYSTSVLLGPNRVVYSNSAFVPGNETWLFYDAHWAEGHDKVIWERLTDPQKDLFPNVYPSANGGERDAKSAELRELGDIAEGFDPCEGYVGSGGGLSGKAGLGRHIKTDEAGKKTKKNKGHYSVGWESKKVVAYEDLGREETDEFHECIYVQAGAAQGYAGLAVQFEGWFKLPKIKLGAGAKLSAYKIKRVRHYKNHDRIVIDELEVLGGKLGIEGKTGDSIKDIKGVKVGGEASGAGLRGRRTYCYKSKPSTCGYGEFRILDGKVKGRVEGGKAKIDRPTGNWGSISVGGKGTFDFPVIGEKELNGEISIGIGTNPISGDISIKDGSSKGEAPKPAPIETSLPFAK